MKGTALVTGATSGIGAAYAEKLAKVGYSVILTGRRMDKLQAKADELSRKYQTSCKAILAELSSDNGIKLLVDLIKTIPDLEILVNNAGFGIRDNFLDISIEGNIEMMMVHDIAAVRLTYAALPAMLARKSGAVICTSSVASYAERPKTGLYSPTKAFLNSFIMTLYRSYFKKGISFQALCPGYTHTDFHEKLGEGKNKQTNHGYFRWMEPEQVVEYSWQCLSKGKIICIPGFFNRFLVWLTKSLPHSFLNKLLGVK